MIDAFRLLPDGTVVGLYTDAIDLRQLGHVRARRASRIEWAQGWVARLLATPEHLGPFQTRAEAVTAERAALARQLAALPRQEAPWTASSRC